MLAGGSEASAKLRRQRGSARRLLTDRGGPPTSTVVAANRAAVGIRKASTFKNGIEDLAGSAALVRF